MAQNTLEIVAKVRADVSEAQKQFQQLFAQFQNFKLDKGSTADITKSFEQVNKALDKLSIAGNNIAGGKASIEQLKMLERASVDVDRAVGNLNHTLNKVSGSNFDFDIDTPEITKTKQEIEQLQKTLSGSYVDALQKVKQAQAALSASNYDKPIGGYSDLLDALSTQDFDKAKQSLVKLENNIDTTANQVGAKIQKIKASIESSVKGKEGNLSSFETFRNDVKTALDKTKADLDNFNQSIEHTSKKNDIFTNFLGKLGNDKGVEKLKSQLEEVKNTLANFTLKDATKLKTQLEQVWGTYTDTKRPDNVSSQAWTGFGRAFQARMEDGGAFQELIQSGEKASQIVDNLKTKLSSFTGEAANLKIKSDFTKMVKGLSLDNLDIGNFDKLIDQKIQNIKQSIADLRTTSGDALALKDQEAQLAALQNFKTAVHDAFGQTTQDLVRNTNDKLQQAFTTLSGQEQQRAQGAMDAFRQYFSTVSTAGNNLLGATSSIETTTQAIARQKEELGQVISRFAYFGTAAGILRTFGRVVRSAFQSVKELDEAMNSIAVVTDYTTKDLWNQIDAYTAMAQATGSTIKGSYEVAQLYYQQGLTDAEVMAATNETLKMARISNIEYSKATDYATAAIKGFGLAYQDLAHVNDVYSNLAAKTAADTREISIAMGKVASIAHSTGMELETTAAFLTQIIATTREAPETAGTALKTVIARFAEVKKLISEGELTGTDEEGTEVSVNKIEEALKTAGVALRDTTGQMRDLDDVFIELASRWDSLDTMQQRYIATQAAGSRQQSRFLAMMNDYEGLQETLGYAMDSEGASQEQFNKTLDSLQSKLNNLSNAWTEFATGIANSDVIKGAVDILTDILNVINDITGAFGEFGGTASKALLLFGGLRYGTGAMGNILQLLGVPTKIPTIKDQWSTGFGSILNAFKVVKNNKLIHTELSLAQNELAGFERMRSSLAQQLFAAEDAGDILGAQKYGQLLEESNDKLLSLQANLANVSAAAAKAGTGFKAFWGALSASAKVSLVIAGLTAIVAIIQLMAKAIKTTKERAEEFQQTLSELQNTSKEIKDLEKTLSDLRAYQEGVKDETGKTVDGMDDFATLQKGVGSYGQNISLTSEQYSRYLEICDAVVALNPDIAKGYNSNAEAIAKNADALDELIAKQQQQIHNKAIQQSLDMNTEFYKNAVGQAKENALQLESATSNLESLYKSTYVSVGEAGGKLTDAFALDLILGSDALTPKKILETYNDLRDQIYKSGKDDNMINKAIRQLDTYYTYYSTRESNLKEQIELSKSAIEEQTDAIKEQWISILPSVDGWYELSDAQQAFVEKYVRGLDIDLTDAKSMESQENEIKRRVAKMQEILNSETIELKVTLPGENEKTWSLKNIIEILGSGRFEELGMEAGLAWLDSFYQAILSGITDPKIQDALMTALGFDGSWEEFGNLGARGFAEQTYGTSYTDRVKNMQKFAAMRREEEMRAQGKTLYGPTGMESYRNWYNWLESLEGQTADTIVAHYEELVATLTESGKNVTQETLEQAAEDYVKAAQNIQSIIQKGVDRGLDKDEISKYMDYLAKKEPDLAQDQTRLAETAVDQMLYEESEKTISDSADTWLDKLQEINDLNTYEGSGYFDGIRESLAGLLNLDLDEIPETFKVSEKLIKAMQAAAKGVPGAIEEVRHELRELQRDATKSSLGKNLTKDTEKQIDDAFDKYEEAVQEFEKTDAAKSIAKKGVGETLSEEEMVEVNNLAQASLDKFVQAQQAAGKAFDATEAAAYVANDLAAQGIEYTPEIEYQSAETKEDIDISGYGDAAIVQGGVVMSGNLQVPVINGTGSSGSKGATSPVKAPSGGGGGGGSKPTKPKQDPFYNYIKTVDDYKKRLESLQDVQEILTKPVDIFNNTKAQEDYYKTLLGSNQSYLNHVNSELERLQKEAQSKYSKYIEISIDGSLRLTEEYWASTGEITEELDEWIDAYDDVLGRQKDLTDEINDYKKELKDLWEGWRDGFIDLTNDIADVFQELDEKQLEDRQEFYEKLEEQDQRYLESVRNNIEEERKARERANSFEDLQKKQSRLALLQRDSSGRYANDIAELQEEINQDQQDLADENVDNILDTLEKQMDKDAERHQDILDAMQKQIDSNVENRIYIERAEQTIAQGEQAILDAIHMGEDWRNASNAEREKMDEEQATNIAGSKSYLEKLNEGITSSSEYISKTVTDALTKQTESLTWTIGDIPQNDEVHVAHAMETTLPSILEQFFARTTTAQDMANDNQVSGARYASGGLVDYTGPAWVDGTPGKPEAFLNANQTAMIAAFTANLAKMVSGKFPSSNIEAGSNCEINIDIGSIGADYDIDQAINKVKQEIINSAQFRNVTLLNRRR